MTKPFVTKSLAAKPNVLVPPVEHGVEHRVEFQGDQPIDSAFALFAGMDVEKFVKEYGAEELAKQTQREFSSEDMDEILGVKRTSANKEDMMSDEEASHHYVTLAKQTSGDQSQHYWKQVLESASKAIALNPNSKNQHYNRGLAHLNLVNVEEALEDFTKELALGHHSDALNAMEIIHMHHAQMDQAFGDSSDDIIELNPDSHISPEDAGFVTQEVALDSKGFKALHQKGRKNLEDGDYEAALNDFNRAIALQLNPDTLWLHFDRGHVLSKLGRDAEAIEDFTAEITLQQKQDLSHYLPYDYRATAYVKLGQFKEACVDITQTIALVPQGTKWLHKIRADIHHKMGNRQEALQDIDTEISINPHPETYSLKMEILYQNEKFEEIEEVRKEAMLTLSPEDARLVAEEVEHKYRLDNKALNALQQKGRKNYQDGDYEAALIDFNKVIASQVNPDTLWLYYERGHVLSKLGRDAEAIEDFTAEITLQQKQDLSHYLPYDYRANAYVKLGQFEEACVDITKAIALVPQGTKWFHKTRADIHHKMGNRQEALQDIDTEISINPHPETYSLKMDILLQDEKFEEIEEIRKEAMLTLSHEDARLLTEKVGYMRPKSLHAIHQKGRKNYEDGDYEAALKNFNRAIALQVNPNTLWLHYDRGYVLSKLGRNAEAIEDFTTEIALRQRRNVVEYIPYNKRAVAHFKLGQFEEACVDITKAIELAPQGTQELHKTRAHIHNKMGNRQEALQDIDTEISINPSTEAYRMRSEIHLSLGNYHHAFQDFAFAYPKTLIVLGTVVMTAAAVASAAAAIARNVAHEVQQPPIARNPRRPLHAPVDVNATYPRETYAPHVKGFLKDMLHYVVDFDEMGQDGKERELQKNAIFNFGEQQLHNVVNKIFALEYECLTRYEIREGQDIEIFELTFGTCNKSPFFQETFVRESPLEAGADERRRLKSTKEFALGEIKNLIDSYVEDLLYDVKHEEEKKCLKDMLVACVELSHQCDLIDQYGDREKNILYDKIAISGDYTKVDMDKLADGKAIFREAGLEYFMNLYTKVAAEKSLDNIVTQIEEPHDIPNASLQPITMATAVDAKRCRTPS